MMRSALYEREPQKQTMRTETNVSQRDYRNNSLQAEGGQADRCRLPECLARHWLASASAIWTRTYGHDCALRQRDLRRRRDLCFAQGYCALLRTGSLYL